jgi:hypothetical protein
MLMIIAESFFEETQIILGERRTINGNPCMIVIFHLIHCMSHSKYKKEGRYTLFEQWLLGLRSIDTDIVG